MSSEQERAEVMMAVRPWAAGDVTHVAAVSLDRGFVRRFAALYYGIEETRAACGALLPTGSIVTKPGSRVTCRPCARATGVTEQRDDVIAEMWRHLIHEEEQQA